MLKMWSTTILMVAMSVSLSSAMDPRGHEHLARCIRMAEPLVQTPEFIFPLNIQDIRAVCRMWDGFVDCVNEYTEAYLSPSHKQEFNLAIRSSIESIHQMCAGEPDYQRSYLSYAPCMKRVSIESSFCGGQYQYLADLVQGTSATDAQLCCAHYKFRDCVLDKTPLECDKDGIAAGSTIPASRFMRDMLDRALGFLLRKCRDFVPNARDCPKTNVVSPQVTTTINTNGGREDDLFNLNDNNNNNNNGNGNGNSIGNNQYLRPDSTTSSGLSSTPFPASTTRFTWTTKSNGAVPPRPTSFTNLAGNGIQGPESQQFRGGASGMIPDLVSIVAAVVMATVLRLQ